jgi:hypothetical protein
MKRPFILLLLSIAITTAKAASNPDSLAYELQRKTINKMLDQRRQKFGQYDESLSKHTGIFGLQTKKDIRRSNDILMDIVKTDNEIFRQTKILLDFRAFQQTQVQTHSKQVEGDALAYMTTITKLRNQLDQVKKQADEDIKKAEAKARMWSIIAIVLFALGVIYISRQRKVKPN